jgi:hypothetical protein
MTEAFGWTVRDPLLLLESPEDASSSSRPESRGSADGCGGLVRFPKAAGPFDPDGFPYSLSLISPSSRFGSKRVDVGLMPPGNPIEWDGGVSVNWLGSAY